MGRPPVIYSDIHPYHITVRSNNRDWFDVPMSYLFGIYANVMSDCIERFKVEPYAFVLMNNHIHFIIRTPDRNVGDFLRYFLTATSKGIGLKSQRINHIYGGRNHKNLIQSPEYFAHCLKYVFRNPVKAGICDRVEDYPWSTVSKASNKMQALVSPIVTGHDKYIPICREQALSWYNIPESDDLNQLIRRAIKRPVFKFKALQDRKHVDRFRELHGSPQY